jgi:hypothetical protein
MLYINNKRCYKVITHPALAEREVGRDLRKLFSK